jgi:adenylate kinase
LVILGPPGAGKGTQAVELAKHFGCADISTGETFRDHVARGTPLGRTAREYIDRGDLVPDEVVIDMVMQRLAEPDARNGFVLDGFPRTVAQAEALDRRLAEEGTPLDAALFFEISEEELLTRVRGRAEQLHRSDDTEATIRHRLEVFAIKTRPLVDYYRHRGVLVPVDAIGEIPEVTRRILADLEVLKAARAANVEPTRADS